jgi:type IV pilus biogenesis protein CpaD/CtpE
MSDDREVKKAKNDKIPVGDEKTEPNRETEPGESVRAQVPDPADIVPVPPAMSAAEIDERAQVVEKLRDERDNTDGDSRREP